MSTDKSLKLPTLEVPRREPTSATGRWLLHGNQLDKPHDPDEHHAWWKVIWLTGVDYFSTLGYQPGIALLAAGAISPIATLILVLVTLFGALPLYSQVASRSYAGQGSIAMLESLLPGWLGKVLVLTLIGFAATDFVITMTLSAADAAVHATQNPLLHPFLGDHNELLTYGMLAVLCAVFLRGFKEAIGFAMAVSVPYIALNLVVAVASFIEIARHPDLLDRWSAEALLSGGGSWASVFAVSALVFPKLALGLSGFETGVSVMPLISDTGRTETGPVPNGRIAATHHMLRSAAVIMSLMLLASSLASTVLVAPEDYKEGGAAWGRVIAFLAHRLLGPTFGTVYDISTILILGFAGASAMTGLLSLIPRYLPRFGMAPQWISYVRPLVLIIFLTNVVVTWVFDADVEAQSGAYATGVLVLILSAAVAVSISFWDEMKQALGLQRAKLGAKFAYYAIVGLVFAFTLIDNIYQRPDGVVIAGVFACAVIVLGSISRYIRATELRVSEVTFVDQESAIMWLPMVNKAVNLVPLRTSTTEARRKKAAEIRKYYAIEGPIAFVHVNLLNNRSDFLSPLQIQVREEDGNLVVDVYGAVAIANTVAYISELIDPISLFLGLTRQNLMGQALRYLIFGEGETGLMVYSILLRYWDSTPEEDVRPLIFLMSE